MSAINVLVLLGQFNGPNQINVCLPLRHYGFSKMTSL